MADDIELADELETPAGEVIDQELEDLEDAGQAPAPTENKWAARRSLSEMLEDADADKAKAKTASTPRQAAAPTAKREEPKADVDGEEEDLDEDENEEEPAKTPEAKPEQAKSAESAKTRYTVKGADGKAFAFELQPGTSIQFKADGREVEAKSIDELVQLAQKGAAYDRKTTEQGQTIAQLRTNTATLQQQVAETRQTAEQTLLAALFDEEKAAELRELLAPYQDEEFRKGQAALAREAERAKQEQESEQTQLEGKRTEFWQSVGSEIRGQLGQFEHLTDADAMEVATRFHAGYNTAYQAKLQELVGAGTPEAKAHEQANAHAFSHFTEKNLRRVMRGLNAELAEERAAAKKGGTPTKQPGSEPAARAAADAHNKKTTDKLDQRRRSPRLQGGGAAPSGTARTPTGPTKPRSFAQRMDSAFSLLRNGDDD